MTVGPTSQQIRSEDSVRVGQRRRREVYSGLTAAVGPRRGQPAGWASLRPVRRPNDRPALCSFFEPGVATPN